MSCNMPSSENSSNEGGMFQVSMRHTRAQSLLYYSWADVPWNGFKVYRFAVAFQFSYTALPPIFSRHDKYNPGLWFFFIGFEL